MYIIKCRNRRANQSAGQYYWTVSRTVSCSTLEEAVAVLMDIASAA